MKCRQSSYDVDRLHLMAPMHNGPNDRVKRKKTLIVIYFSKVLMDFFHLYLEILNVNKRFGLCIDIFHFLFLRILGEFL